MYYQHLGKSFLFANSDERASGCCMPAITNTTITLWNLKGLLQIPQHNAPTTPRLPIASCLCFNRFYFLL